MSEFEHAPEPDKDTDNNAFDFSALEAVEVESLDSEFVAPDVTATKGKWWKQKQRKTADSGKRERKTRTTPPMPRGGLKPALTSMYSGIGAALMPFDPSCARIVIENAEHCAESLDELAKTNPAVRRALISLVTTSAWGAVIMAHAPIVMAIAMHHVPALRQKQEKMIGEMAEMFANGFPQTNNGENK